MGRIEKRERLMAVMVTYGTEGVRQSADNKEAVCFIDAPKWVWGILAPVNWVDTDFCYPPTYQKGKITPHAGKPYLKHAIKRVFRGQEHKRSFSKLLQYMYSPLFPYVFGSRYFYRDGIDHVCFELPDSFNGGDAVEFVRWFNEVLGIIATREGNKVVLDDNNYKKLLELYNSDSRIRRLIKLNGKEESNNTGDDGNRRSVSGAETASA
jgi:hypothetical protein